RGRGLGALVVAPVGDPPRPTKGIASPRAGTLNTLRGASDARHERWGDPRLLADQQWAAGDFPARRLEQARTTRARAMDRREPAARRAGHRDSDSAVAPSAPPRARPTPRSGTRRRRRSADGAAARRVASDLR